MQWPGKIDAGSEFTKPVISLDLFDTSLGLAEIETEIITDGVDLMPFVTAEESDVIPHEMLFWRVGKRSALRRGDWKLVRQKRRGESGEWELYNLADDISEVNNIADEEGDILEEMIGEWEDRNSEMVEPVF